MDAAPRSWSHDTPWRQGMLLCTAALDHFRMRSGVDDTTTCAIVISHDCDLAQDDLQHEPMVEVVVRRVVEKGNGNFTWAKSPRTLHLAMPCEGLPVTLELVATNKRLLDKQALAAFDPYQLSIVLVFHPGDDADRAADAADALAENLERTVRARIDAGSEISLKSCFAISEDDVTISQARVLRHWRLEHLTMRASTPQPGPPTE